MSGNDMGALRTAAIRIGVSVDEYRNNLGLGLKWCIGHKVWHLRREFAIDKSRGDGYTPSCKEYRNELRRSLRLRIRKPGIRRGMRIVAARNGDRYQARGRINHLITLGLLPRPSSLPCFDCGDIENPHDYDHFMGYAPEHHEHVQPVCRPCHLKRHSRQKQIAELNRFIGGEC